MVVGDGLELELARLRQELIEGRFLAYGELASGETVCAYSVLKRL